jgi:hypothetical protein
MIFSYSNPKYSSKPSVAIYLMTIFLLSNYRIVNQSIEKKFSDIYHVSLANNRKLFRVISRALHFIIVCILPHTIIDF